MLSLTRVRIVSLAAASALMALLLLCAASTRVDRTNDPGSAPAILAFIDAPQAPPQPKPPPAHRPAAHATASLSLGDNENDVRLWRYNAHGDVVFAYAEQFDRCTQARAQHRMEADCPNPRETRAYVLEQGDHAPIELTLRH